MTPRDFIANFDTIAEAPNGIARLREFVLQLAVRGRLVPQAPEDEPATMLLDRITAERNRLVKDKKISKPKMLPEITRDEMPAEVPEGWIIARFGALFLEVFTGPFGTSLKKSEYVGDGTPVINPQNLKSGCIVPTPETAVGPATLKRLTGFRVVRNDLVVARRGEMGRCAVVGAAETGWLCGTGSMVLRPAEGIYPPFVEMFLRSPSTIDRLSGDSVGATMKNLNQRIMLNLVFALPPAAEQHRIVAKVGELMGLLDRLEETRHRREIIRAASRDSALAALRAANSADEIKIAWMRIAVRMDELFITPADVTPLREAVIQLAIRGRLIAQDPEKVDNCCEQHFTETQEQTQSFELPSGWIWSNLKLLGRVCGGGTPSKRNPEFWSGDIPWISPKDMKRDLINQSQDMVTAKAIDSSSIKLVPSGALLMVVRGMILDHSFPVAVTETEVTINQDMKALIPFDSRLSRYLLLLMKGMKVEILKLVKTSTHGTCRLPTHDLFSITLPIPPIEIQQRIISKVDDVMNVLDQLSLRLTAQRNAHNTFATSLLHHLNT